MYMEWSSITTIINLCSRAVQSDYRILVTFQFLIHEVNWSNQLTLQTENSFTHRGRSQDVLMHAEMPTLCDPDIVRSTPHATQGTLSCEKFAMPSWLLSNTQCCTYIKNTTAQVVGSSDTKADAKGWGSQTTYTYTHTQRCLPYASGAQPTKP